MFRRFGILALGIVALAFGPGPAAAEWVTVFQDDFSGSSLDATKWAVESAFGQYEVSAGFLHMRSIPSGFPEIASRVGLIPASGRLRVQFGFQYTSTACYGTRLGLQARGVFLSQCPNSPPLVPGYYVHRDCAKGTNVNVYPVTDGFGACGHEMWGRTFESSPPAYHVVEFSFAADSVSVAIDGVSTDTDVSGAPRPNTIDFGGPGDPCCNYTEYNVDFVQVQVWDEPVPASAPSWGQVKDRYRK